MKPHPQAEFIKAKADGHIIQYKGSEDDVIWHDLNENDWDFEGNLIFRIKPEPPKYPQTRMSEEAICDLLDNALKTSGFEARVDACMAAANTIIARAIEDGQVAILRMEPPGLSVDPQGILDTSYCMEVIGQGRISGTKKVIDYVANKLLDAPDMVPAAMLEKVALEVRNWCRNQFVAKATSMTYETAYGLISNVDIASIIASVRDGK